MHTPVLPSESVQPLSRSAKLALQTLKTLFGDDYIEYFAIELWDGTVVPSVKHEKFRLFLRTPYALRAALTPPLNLHPAEAFIKNLIDVEGDLEFAVALIMRNTGNIEGRKKIALGFLLMQHPHVPAAAAVTSGFSGSGKTHGRARDSEAIRFHYDLPLSFYRTFLDPELVYSCGYFTGDTRSLADAQTAKIDHILKKLDLKPHQTLLDVGCGCGALVLRAAKYYGARAYGITLSQRQFIEAQRRIKSEALDNLVTVEIRDYRDLAGRTFDAISSVGMIEHIGKSQLPVYFTTLYAALRPGGRFLNHGISDQSQGRNGEDGAGFISRYVFPDGELPPFFAVAKHAELAGFEVRDVENLREHYTRTLRLWRSNLRAHAQEAQRISGERTFRIYDLYLAGSAQGFTAGRLSIFQTLFVKPHLDGSSDMPATRRSFL